MIYASDENLSDLREKSIIIESKNDSIVLEYQSDYLTTEFLYFSVLDGTLICSFDIFELQKKITESEGQTKIDQEVLPFFIEKGYTPFDRTYITGIYKLPNLVRLIYNTTTKSIKYALAKIEIDKNISPEDIIFDSIESSIESNKYNYLLFSGGYDSTLIAEIVRQKLHKSQIELITGNLNTIDYIPNIEDVKYSKIIASLLDLPLQIVEKNLNSVSVSDLENIIYNRPTTAHFSIVYQSIKDYLDSTSLTDYHVLSGQQADSILNLGASSFFKIKGRDRFLEGKGELIIRFLYLSSPIYSKILFSLVNDVDNEGYILSPVIGNNKLPIIGKKDVYQNLLQIYKDFVTKFNREDAKFIKSSFLLIYVFTFLSGSDASGIISTFNADNSLPFSKKTLLWYFITKQNTLLDKIIPKRPIMNLLKQNQKLWDSLRMRPNTPAFSYLVNFYKIGDNLGLKDYLQDTEKLYDLKLPYTYNSIHLLKCLQNNK